MKLFATLVAVMVLLVASTSVVEAKAKHRVAQHRYGTVITPGYPPYDNYHRDQLW